MKKIKIVSNNEPAFVTFPIYYFAEEKIIPQLKEITDFESEIEATVLTEKRVLHPKLERDGYNGYNCKTPFLLKYVVVDYIWVQSGEEYYRAYQLECDALFYNEYSEK